MIFYSFTEICLLIAAAIILDWIIGDPKWPTHPVIWIGRWIKRLEGRLIKGNVMYSDKQKLYRGAILTASTIVISMSLMLVMTYAAHLIHPWIGYGVSAWFISTTIAVKGLRDAAMLVYHPLIVGDLEQARKYIGYIVSRDQEVMGEQEISRAAVETVSENIVDAFVSPIFWAFIGGAPLAIGYRATNTLDSMVGYRNEKYEYFGKVSARLDDILNFIPARITGCIVISLAYVFPNMSGHDAVRAVIKHAAKHPSPNSGIPEAAVAGALGIQLGGSNRYFGVWHERARLGWPKSELSAKHIKQAVIMLYSVSIFIWIGVTIACLIWSVIKQGNM